MKHRDNKLSRRSGMTILEMLIALSIIALIASVAGPRLIGYLGRAKSETAKLQVDQIKNALQLFYIDVGRYPAESEGLAVLIVSPAGEQSWAGPYLENSDGLNDPWGRPYLYSEPSDGGEPIVQSFGKDGARGGSGESQDISG